MPSGSGCKDRLFIIFLSYVRIDCSVFWECKDQCSGDIRTDCVQGCKDRLYNILVICQDRLCF